jgi:uncharacterized protein YdeI (BOF family)
MVCVLLAFSPQAQVEKYGAYFGIASFLGLALLSILYFAQAREVRRLREWSAESPDRDRELEARLNAQASRRAESLRPPAPAAEDTQVVAPPAATPAGNGRAATLPPGLPVPMGPRPAVAAARVAAAVGATPATEPEPEPASGASATAPGDDGAAAGDGASPAESREERPPVIPVPQETAEVDRVDRDDDGYEPEPAAIPRATPRPAPAASAGRPAQPLRTPARTATVPPRRPAAAPARGARRRDGHGRGILVAVIAGVVVVALAGAYVFTRGGDDTPSAPNTTAPAPTPTAGTETPSAAAPAKADTTVVILNGTITDGLAAESKAALEGAGYSADRIPTGTSNNQTVARSSVYYADGRRRLAMDIARVLGIDAVARLDPDTQALAENSADPPVQADVVVILGADRTP